MSGDPKTCKCGRPSFVETGECDRCTAWIATQGTDPPWWASLVPTRREAAEDAAEDARKS